MVIPGEGHCAGTPPVALSIPDGGGNPGREVTGLELFMWESHETHSPFLHTAPLKRCNTENCLLKNSSGNPNFFLFPAFPFKLN